MANFNLNKVIIGGRLTADPELKTTSSGISVTTFSVAVNRKYQAKNAEDTQADFFHVTAWRQTAEFVTRYFHKASSICVVGTLQNRSWVAGNNVKQYRTEIVADEVFFVDAKNENPYAAQSAPAFSGAGAQPYVPDNYGAPTYTNANAGGEAPKFEEINDDELPF